jgi:hypothetical protein
MPHSARFKRRLTHQPTHRIKHARRAVRVADTPCGRGIFARVRFHQGETVAEVKGTIHDEPHYWSAYGITLDARRVLEPLAPLRFINHSCNPNCELIDQTVWDDAAGEIHPRVHLDAVREVQAGEELTIDYGWPAACAIPCLCGSRNCRGWVVAVHQLHAVQNHSTTNNLL